MSIFQEYDENETISSIGGEKHICFTQIYSYFIKKLAITVLCFLRRALVQKKIPKKDFIGIE